VRVPAGGRLATASVAPVATLIAAFGIAGCASALACSGSRKSYATVPLEPGRLTLGGWPLPPLQGVGERRTGAAADEETHPQNIAITTPTRV